MRHDKATMNYQRKMLAKIGFLLPLLCVVPGLPFMDVNGTSFWHSISATYYATTKGVMIMVLGVFAFFLWTYKGYDIGDKFTCRFSALMAVGIVTVPCNCEAAGPTTGLLNLPTEISHVIHCIIAGLLFASFAYMIGARFTKSSRAIVFTEGKRKRNTVYYVCAIIIVAFMWLQAITSLFHIGWFTIINEAFMLWAFSFAWAVKADCFRWFDDEV